jgi:hypothetical protein
MSGCLGAPGFCDLLGICRVGPEVLFHCAKAVVNGRINQRVPQACIGIGIGVRVICVDCR